MGRVENVVSRAHPAGEERPAVLTKPFELFFEKMAEDRKAAARSEKKENFYQTWNFGNPVLICVGAEKNETGQQEENPDQNQPEPAEKQFPVSDLFRSGKCRLLCFESCCSCRLF